MSLTFTAKQLEAVEHVHGPMLVVAGAGTGKTTVLTQRIVRLIGEGHARPDEILAVTFTENAAAELCDRVRSQLEEASAALRGKKRPRPEETAQLERLTAALRGLTGLQARTFHAYCCGVLERCGKAFQLVLKEDLWIYLRLHMEELALERYTRAVRPAEFLEALLGFFEECHDELRTVEDYQAYVEQVCAGKFPLPRVVSSKQAEDMPREEVLARLREIARVYRKVEDILRAHNWGTFGHMILHAMQCLRQDSEMLARERARARFVLVDEFQDCNIAQIELAQLLAGNGRNLFVVGDPDQAIYRFRGASSRAFEEFARRFSDTAVVLLQQNRRSRTAILQCASAVIENNPPVDCRLGQPPIQFKRQPLISARDTGDQLKGNKPPQALVELVSFADTVEEAGDVAAQAKRLQQARRDAAQGQSAFGFAARQSAAPLGVLYRSHAHRAELVRELARRGVAFCVKGIDALQTPEGRDLMACLRVLHSPYDSGALFRVAALPKFSVNAGALREALAGARKGQVDFPAILATVPGGAAVVQEVQTARVEAAAADMKARAAVGIAIQRFGLNRDAVPVVTLRGFIESWEHKPTVRTGTLAEFVEYMEHFREAGGLLEMPSRGEQDPDAVQLMTVHSAKGLEFEHVWMLRANSGSFPTGFREKLFEFPRELRSRSLLDESQGKEAHKEEERRLFYVAMTRARDSLAIYGKLGRGKKPDFGAFLKELKTSKPSTGQWQQRAAAYTIDVEAAAAPAVIGVAAWLLMPPSVRLLGASLSATAIETYETCPLKFKIARDWSVPGEVAAGMQFGAVMHSLLKTYYDGILAGRPRSEEQLQELLRNSLAEAPFDDEHQRRLFEKQGRRQLKLFLEACRRRPQPAVLSTEQAFEIMVRGVRVRGRIDRMDCLGGDARRVSIRDYKTGAPKDDSYARQSLQLSIYALAAREKWKVVAEELVVHNLEDDSEVITTRDVSDLEEAQERIALVADRIAAGEFEPTPSYNCRTCQYRLLCPATEERLY